MTDLTMQGSFGSITLVRHGEPALSRRVRLTSQDYRQWWDRYEDGGLLAGQTPPAALVETVTRAGAILSSGRRRSVETAHALTVPDRVQIEPLFIEAPLPPPPLPDWIRLSPRLWGFVARVCWWFFDQHQGQESRAQAEVRAKAAADRVMALARTHPSVVVLAHGFFNTMVGRELVARGWKCSLDQGYHYWCMRRFEPR